LSLTHVWPLVFFLFGSVPLVWQDLEKMEVTQSWLFLVLGGWALAAWGTTDTWPSAAALSAGVLTLGALLLLVLPGTLGEADVVYMAALAWLLPFWSFLLALGLSVVLASMAFAAVSIRGHRNARLALPFLPFLALGGLGAWGAA